MISAVTLIAELGRAWSRRNIPITKTGNTHARIGPGLRQEGLPEDVRDIAWNAQLRLCHRYRRLIAYHGDRA
jgi:hypothetical protein